MSVDLEKPDKKKEVTRWTSRIDDAESKRDQFKSDREKNYEAVYGDDWLKDGDTKKRSDTGVQQKQASYEKLNAYLKTEIPSLILYRPEVFLQATEESVQRNPEAAQAVKQWEVHINRILNDMDGWEYHVKTCLADAHCAGWAVIKVIHEPEFNKQNPDFGTEIQDTEGNLIKAEEYLYSGSKFKVQRVDPFKFLIDSDCKNDPNEAAWKGEEVPRTIDQLERSGLYAKEIIEKIKEKTKDKGKEPWEIKVTLYEVYHAIEDRLMVICEEYKDEFIRDEDTPEGIDIDPYAILKFWEVPGQFHAKAEISSGRQLQDDEIEVRRWAKAQAKKSRPILGLSGAIAEDEAEQKKLTDGISDWVKCSPNDVNPINNDLKFGDAVGNYATILQQDFDEVMGQTQQERGIVGKADFATEVEVAEMKGSVREQDKLNCVKMFFECIIEKIIFQMRNSGYAQLNQLPLDVDMDIEIDITSKTPKNKAIERKQYIELGQAYPEVFKSPTFMQNLLRSFDMREIETIIQEIQQASQPQTQPNVPKLGVNVSFKGELLPNEVADKVLDIAFNTDIPMQVKGGNGGAQPATAEPVGAGTEGMEVGSGQMPMGGQV